MIVDEAIIHHNLIISYDPILIMYPPKYVIVMTQTFFFGKNWGIIQDDMANLLDQSDGHLRWSSLPKYWGM